MELLIEVAGWAAALLILAAYALLTAGKVDAQSPLYQGMNAAGAIGFIINTSAHGAWPSAALNVVWLAIGAIALVRIVRRP